MRNKFIPAAGLLLSIGLLQWGCQKGPNFKEYSYPPQKASGFSPATGFPGTNVTITGTNFDTLKGAVKVWFGGVLATTVVSDNGTQIVVKVPSNAVTGKLGVQVWTTKSDSIGLFTVLPAPAISSVASNNSPNNIAFPGDTVFIRGSHFGTDASAIAVSFNGTPSTIITPISDGLIKVIAPNGYATGLVTLTTGGVTFTGTPAIINPTAPGDITPYFLSNYAAPVPYGTYDGSRFGTLPAPWVSNAAALNKGGGIYGGWAAEPWNGTTGFINWETWNQTPVVDGIIYQPTRYALPAGSYTVSCSDYSEIQTNSSTYCVAAAGGNGIPVLANLSTALGYAALYNGAVVGTTKPSATETKSFNFTLTSSQIVSIGFLGNLAGGGANFSPPGNYFIVKWIKLVRN